jgi:selenocysteine lyase/cysteine desulfurase
VLFCVDAIQQIGAALRRTALSVRFAMADGHSGCSAPRAWGVLLPQHSAQQLKLHAFGWHMLEQLGDFERRTWQPARSARRFEPGSPNMLGACALEASLSLLEEVGMQVVAEQLGRRVEQLHQGLAAIPGVQQLPGQQTGRRAGIVNFTVAAEPMPTFIEC